MNDHNTSRRGMTLIELLVVMAVILILAGLFVAGVSSVIDSARTTQCMSNLRQISMALVQYQGDFGGQMPPGDLPRTLDHLLDQPDVFVCPNDDTGSGDSYSEFYVPRGELESSTIMVACPRHRSNEFVSALYGGSQVQNGTAGEVKHNGGDAAVGDVVTGGVLTFDDGSTAQISGGLKVQVLTSYNEPSGSLYTILRVLPDQEGEVECTVTDGSRFEVITPAAIAGVQGTRFKVFVQRNGEKYRTTIQTLAGRVRVQDVCRGGVRKVLKQGQQAVRETLREVIDNEDHRFWDDRDRDGFDRDEED